MAEYEIISLKFPEKLYSKDVIFHAIYVLIEEYYFIVNFEEDSFLVEIYFDKNIDKSKKEIELEFNKELIEANAYFQQLKNTSKIRESLLKKAIFSQKALKDLDND